MTDKLGRYEEVVDVEDVAINNAMLILRLLIEHLGVEVIGEITPDYTSYRIRSKA